MESEMSNAQEKENEQQQLQQQQQQLPPDNPPAVPTPTTPFTDSDMDKDKPPEPSPVPETQNPNPTLDRPESEDSQISAPHQSDKPTDEQQLPNNPPSPPPPPPPPHEVAETKLISVVKSQPLSASSSSDIDGGPPSVPKDQNAAAAAASIPNKHIEEDAKTKLLETPPPANKSDDHSPAPKEHNEPGPSTNARTSSIKVEAGNKSELDTPAAKNNDTSNSKYPFLLDNNNNDGNESGTEEEQSEFMKELENFFRERSMDFKPPKFYGELLNCLKLWRSVMRLGGYDKVTSCKWWRQVGESFKPPKTCTTVSWTFRGFYEKALLDYERHKTHGSDFKAPVVSTPKPVNVDNPASGSGRTVRESAQRAMINWHSERVLDNGEVSEAIIKDKNSVSSQKREKQGKSSSLPKRRRPSEEDHPVKAARAKESKLQLDVEVVDIGPPADWVKINVQKTKDSFEVYALVPGLLREEVRVQSDPAGRLVISGEPEHPDNPWGVKPFRKVVTLPSRIDPHQTSAVVTLHGQLFVRVPFQQSDQ